MCTDVELRGVMAIRFRCSGCEKAIEVDDPFGGGEAICPYCQNVLMVPSASTIAVAAPAGGSVPPPPVPADAITTDPAARRARTLANASLGCGILGAVLFVGFLIAGVVTLLPDLNTAPGQPAPTAEEMRDAIGKNPTAQKLFGLLIVGPAMCAIGMALALTSISASRRENGRAIVAIVLCAPFVLCCVWQVIAQASGSV